MGAMDGKVCLVTGATSGIGKASATALVRLGATVIAHGRDEARLEAAAGEIRGTAAEEKVHTLLADLSSLKEVRAAASRVLRDFDRLDVLLNNAGGIFGRRVVTEDGLERTFQVDYLSHFLLTNMLLERLRSSAPSRVISVSSGLHNLGRVRFDDLQLERYYSPVRSYSQAKLAQVMFTYELAAREKGSGIAANALDPGWVLTRFGREGGPLIKYGAMVGYLFAQRPQRGAETAVYLAASREVEGITGRYFVNEKAVSSSKASYDRTAQRRLWEVSEELAGLRPFTAPRVPA